MTEQTVINEFMNVVIQSINAGFGFIQNDVWWLFQVLVVINLTLAGLYWALGSDEAVVGLMKRVLLIGFVAFLVENWPYLTDTLAKSFVQLGLTAGGNGVSQEAFLDPGRVAGLGYLIANQLWDAASELIGPAGIFANFIEILVLFLAGMVVLVAFFVFALQILLAVVAFKLGSLVVFVLVPFAVLTKTAFLAERPLGYLFSAAVRLMVMAFVVSVAFRLFNQFTVGNPDEVTIRSAVALAFGAMLVLTLAFLAPRIAADVVAGAPSLGLGDLIAPTAVVGGLGYASGRPAMFVGRHVGGLALRGGQKTVRAATNAASRSGRQPQPGSAPSTHKPSTGLPGGNKPSPTGGGSTKDL